MIRIFATGQDDYITEDRDALHATLGAGNTDQLEVFLTFSTPGHEEPLGWFRVADLQRLIDTAVRQYQNGTPA